MLRDDERLSFDCYFASITSMQFHPGAGTKEHKRLTLEECRDVALQMVLMKRELLKDEE